jgi:cytochrome c-type biogenesis protein CcmE
VKPAGWIGLVIILGAMAFSAKAFVTNLTPYVTFDQARGAKTASVQVMGSLDKTSIKNQMGGLKFDLLSKEGDRMSVVFEQAKPANFEQAIEVTAIGRYDGATFRADRLLVKCPSKYQGTETKEYGAAQKA